MHIYDAHFKCILFIYLMYTQNDASLEFLIKIDQHKFMHIYALFVLFLQM